MAHLPIDSHALRASSILLPGLATVHLDSFQPCPWTYFLRFAGLFGAEYSITRLLGRGSVRITPAHAGKSPSSLATSTCWRDHPRACGEKKRLTGSTFGRMGSPPHTRGKGVGRWCKGGRFRITPAHAGKRLLIPGTTAARWDHPRTRGEKYGDDQRKGLDQGSPPHTRGKVSDTVVGCKSR